MSLDNAIGLRRALTRLVRRLRTEAREPGSTSAKLSILGHLHRDGPKTPGALALAEGIQPQSLTRVLADLEESGLALRRQDDLDRRQFLLEITPAGQDLLFRDAKRRALWLAGAMAACLSPTEQELLRLAAQLMERLANVRNESLNQEFLMLEREFA